MKVKTLLQYVVVTLKRSRNRWMCFSIALLILDGLLSSLLIFFDNRYKVEEQFKYTIIEVIISYLFF